MIETRSIMTMPITVAIADGAAGAEALNRVFAYFNYIDEKFSVFKKTSEISLINQGLIGPDEYSRDMKTVLVLCEKTKRETGGYFDIAAAGGESNPSGLVKGWAIYNAAKILADLGCNNFYINTGGDIDARGNNEHGRRWSVGIRNPFNGREIVKTVYLENQGIATSGSYERGRHIYNPFDRAKPLAEIVSLTVIGPNVYEADRFATAAFAMGRKGIMFIEKLPGLEAYQIDKDGQAVMTSGFEKYLLEF